MSKHLGNVVDPDELVARYGADTVRLAVLYAASPQKSLNWSDSAVLRCSRFLTQVWDYSHVMIARQAAAQAERERSAGALAEADGDEPVRDNTEHLRLKLSQWCEAGVGRITKDMESLETHSAVRNVMRLFDRIKDFEKRVVAREGELNGANVDALMEALTVLAQVLGPLAPHLAEELWIAFGHDARAAQTPWPGVWLRVHA
jgi:leucyl-tRNA synthetase